MRNKSHLLALLLLLPGSVSAQETPISMLSDASLKAKSFEISVHLREIDGAFKKLVAGIDRDLKSGKLSPRRHRELIVAKWQKWSPTVRVVETVAVLKELIRRVEPWRNPDNPYDSGTARIAFKLDSLAEEIERLAGKL